jgi:hypothetical protein
MQSIHFSSAEIDFMHFVVKMNGGFQPGSAVGNCFGAAATFRPQPE